MDPIQVCDTGMLDLGSLVFGLVVGWAAGVVWHIISEENKRTRYEKQRAARQAQQ